MDSLNNNRTYIAAKSVHQSHRESKIFFRNITHPVKIRIITRATDCGDDDESQNSLSRNTGVRNHPSLKDVVKDFSPPLFRAGREEENTQTGGQTRQRTQIGSQQKENVKP
ncbi:hypothetical protein NPIL_1811 [Nephila pilipes]|uniref:Uncharacterized protein n=1 Tax=Nephila pilipes TaxID=299642 RepID=A0A8X6P3I1_NEPPI|nr:hypothetical protein NPIL_1811 [Nephila pilipes]